MNRKTSVDILVQTGSAATNNSDAIKNELKNELKSRLNPKPTENKGRSMINGRLLLKNIEDELKDEISSMKVKSGFEADDDSTPDSTSSSSQVRKTTSYNPSSFRTTTPMSLNKINSPTGNPPNLRMRKFSQDSSMMMTRPMNSMAQSRTFNLLKETLDNGLVQKDAIFRDSIGNKRSVRRCSLTVTAANLETAKIIEEESTPNENEQKQDINNNKNTTINKENTEDDDTLDDVNIYKFRTAPRSHSLVDDRLMTTPRLKAAYHLSRLSIDYGGQPITLAEQDENNDESSDGGNNRPSPPPSSPPPRPAIVANRATLYDNSSF